MASVNSDGAEVKPTKFERKDYFGWNTEPTVQTTTSDPPDEQGDEEQFPENTII